jgi:hypothetical protein
MTPLPLPDPLPLPAPAWLLSSLLLLMFVLHALPMNLLLGGSVIGAVSRLRGRRDEKAAALADRIARALPVVMAATITPGVAALLFLQARYGRVFFSATILMAVPWLSIVPLFILAYYGAYLAASGGREARGAWRVVRNGVPWGIALLVVAIGVIFSNAMSLMARPESFAARFAADASGLHLNFGDPTLAPRVLHVLLGAIALAGAAVSVGGFLLRRRDAALSQWMVRHGVLWCTGATALNLLPGFWWLAALPRDTLLRFLGRDPLATLLFAAGILAGLSALGHLIPAALADEPRSLLAGGAGSMVASVACMAGVRDLARRADLEAAGFRVTPWVVPQWGAIALFAVFLAAAAVTVGWMLRKMMKAAPGDPARGGPPTR